MKLLRIGCWIALTGGLTVLPGCSWIDAINPFHEDPKPPGITEVPPSVQDFEGYHPATPYAPMPSPFDRNPDPNMDYRPDTPTYHKPMFGNQ